MYPSFVSVLIPISFHKYKFHTIMCLRYQIILVQCCGLVGTMLYVLRCKLRMYYLVRTCLKGIYDFEYLHKVRGAIVYLTVIFSPDLHDVILIKMLHQNMLIRSLAFKSFKVIHSYSHLFYICYNEFF